MKARHKHGSYKANTPLRYYLLPVLFPLELRLKTEGKESAQNKPERGERNQ
jgi:hypothetical protein